MAAWTPAPDARSTPRSPRSSSCPLRSPPPRDGRSAPLNSSAGARGTGIRSAYAPEGLGSLRSTLRRGRGGRVFGRPAHPRGWAPLRSTLRRGRGGRVFGRPPHPRVGSGGRNNRAARLSSGRPNTRPPRLPKSSAPLRAQAACTEWRPRPAYGPPHTGAPAGRCIAAPPTQRGGAAPSGRGGRSGARWNARGRLGPGSFSAEAESGGSVVPPDDSNPLGA